MITHRAVDELSLKTMVVLRNYLGRCIDANGHLFVKENSVQIVRIWADSNVLKLHPSSVVSGNMATNGRLDPYGNLKRFLVSRSHSEVGLDPAFDEPFLTTVSFSEMMWLRLLPPQPSDVGIRFVTFDMGTQKERCWARDLHADQAWMDRLKNVIRGMGPKPLVRGLSERNLRAGVVSLNR